MTVTLHVRDFGPIERATFELKPLTVLIGPNNSGKSVAAMLTYAVTQSGMVSSRYPTAIQARRLIGPRDEEVVGSIGRLMMQLHAEGPSAQIRVPQKTARWIDRQIETALVSFVRGVVSQIERSFSTKLSELCRHGPRKDFPLVLGIESSGMDWSVALDLRDELTNIHINRQPKAAELLRSALAQFSDNVLDTIAQDRDTEPDVYGDYLARELGRMIPQLLMAELPYKSYYLPAERSGILQSHRQLASIVVRQSPFVGIEDLQVPRMSGVVSDFIGNLLQLDSDIFTEFHDVAAELERDVLAGSIEIEADTTGYPDISYQAGRVQYPLHRSSSMVSEIAPIVVYLRHLLDPGELFIIEEPESHLHPKSQVALAQSVAKMIAGGLGVLLTTHSDYFLGQLNNAIRLGTLSREEGARTQTLLAEDVSAYLFTRQGAASRVSAVEVTDHDGISEDEFSRVAEDLYETTVRLDEALGHRE